MGSVERVVKGRRRSGVREVGGRKVRVEGVNWAKMGRRREGRWAVMRGGVMRRWEREGRRRVPVGKGVSTERSTSQ